MTTAAQFVAAARSLKGAKWRHQGRKDRAVDCIGVVVVSAWKSGMDVNDETGYGREPWEDRIRAGCRERWGAPLPASKAQPGDVAIVRWADEEPSHMGIIGDHPDGGLTIIHSQQIHGVIEQGLRGKLLDAVLEVYRPIWSEA